MKTRMAFEPSLDLGVLVGGVVVGDQVQGEAAWGGALDGTQKFEPLLMAMPLHALSDDLAGGDVEGGEQRRGAPGLRRGRLWRL